MLDFRTDPVVVNGIFCVDKPDGSLRLIVDARPANSLFEEPEKVELPTPDLLSRIKIPPGRQLFVAKSDAADFFFQFALPEWMVPWFGLPAVLTSELSALGLDLGFRPDEVIAPCLRVLPMGFSHSPFLAQEAQVHSVPFGRFQSCGRDRC